MEELVQSFPTHLHGVVGVVREVEFAGGLLGLADGGVADDDRAGIRTAYRSNRGREHIKEAWVSIPVGRKGWVGGREPPRLTYHHLLPVWVLKLTVCSRLGGGSHMSRASDCSLVARDMTALPTLPPTMPPRPPGGRDLSSPHQSHRPALPSSPGRPACCGHLRAGT